MKFALLKDIFHGKWLSRFVNQKYIDLWKRGRYYHNNVKKGKT